MCCGILPVSGADDLGYDDVVAQVSALAYSGHFQGHLVQFCMNILVWDCRLRFHEHGDQK